MRYIAKTQVLFDGRLLLKGEAIELPEDPCRGDILEGSADPADAEKVEKERLVALAVKARLAPPSVVERWSLERLREAQASGFKAPKAEEA